MISTERGVAPGLRYFVHTPSRLAQSILLYPVQCGSFVYEKGYTLARSSFDSFLLMYVRRGAMSLTLEGKSLPVREGSFVLLDCYRPHGYASKDGCEVLWLHFDGAVARGFYEAVSSKLGNVFRLEDPTPVAGRMDRVFQTFAEGKPVREVLLDREIHGLLTELLLRDPEGGGESSGASERVMAYIHEHLTDELPVDSLAALAGMSVGHFIRVFRRETGYTPHGYIVSCRMASARYLLKYTTMPVKEICYSTGFSSESVFCSAFKKQHGMTPQEYRAV